MELKSYSKALRVLSKGYLPYIINPTFKIKGNFGTGKRSLTKTSKDCGLVLGRLYLYYDMKLVVFGIENEKNLIFQFPVFVQPYTQTKLTLYQIEMVPVPILQKVIKPSHIPS